MSDDDERELRIGDRIVCEGIGVCSVMHVTDRWVEVYTNAGIVRVPHDSPMRRALDRRAAEAKIAETAALAFEERRLVARDAELVRELAAATFGIPRAVRRVLLHGSALEEPFRMLEHVYEGSFDVAERLLICDPCYVDRDGPALLVSQTPARRGTWHAYVRVGGWLSDVGRSLLAVHGDFLDSYKEDGRALGRYGVDSGCALVADARIRDDATARQAFDALDLAEEGIIGAYGCLVRTPEGDGVYSARVIERGDEAVGVRMNLTRDPRWDTFEAPPDPEYVAEVNARLAAASANVRDYSPKETFAVGDHVRHAKFGEGVVELVRSDGKIEIAFRDARRTLLHLHGK